MGRLLTLMGGFGASVGLLCCFTGLLPFLLTAIGAGHLIQVLYRDVILLPFVALSLVVMGIGIWLMRRART